jgi:branched-chain amino acid transport system substrate-binding protein
MKHFIRKYWYAILIQMLLMIIAFSAFNSLHSKEDIISIAIIVGEEEGEHNSKIEALKLYADRLNKQNGVQGKKKLHIEVYFAHNNPERAREIAEEIVKNTTIIGVIGDFDYKTPQSIVDIYEEATISLMLTRSHIKTESSVVFQMSPLPKSYGAYMANYSYNILNKRSVIIAYSNRADDLELIGSFIKTFEALGGEVESKHLIHQNPYLISQLKQNFEEDSSGKFLLLIGEEQDRIPLIVALKRDNIHLDILSNDADLGGKFSSYPEEASRPGYFSDGIFTPSPLIIDNLPYDLAATRNDYDKKYNKYIDHKAIITADAAFMMLHRIGEQLDDISIAREELKANLKKEDYFNENQQAVGAILTIGKFNYQHLVTAPIDPVMVELGDLSKDDHKKILDVNGEKIYPSNTVYTGISMNKISDIDMENLTYKMDFFLWFRYKKGIENAEDIEFLNTKKAISLLDLMTSKKKNKDTKKSNTIEAKRVENILQKGIQYSRYHVVGYFKTHQANNYALGRQDLFVKFRNRHENLFKLAYVVDYFNTNRGVFSREEFDDPNKLKALKFDVIEEPSLTLNYNLGYISESYKTLLGNPVGTEKANVFSEYIAQYSVKPILWSVRGIESWVNAQLPGGEDKIEVAAMVLFLSLSLMIFIFTLYGQRVELFGRLSTVWWFLQLLVIFLILLFAEFALSQTLFNLKYSTWGQSHLDTISSLMQYANKTIAILWWLVPAYYITSAFEQFLWDPIKRKTGAEVPNVLRIFITIIIYLLAIMGIMAFVLEVTMTSLAATSGVLALMFAIASKVDISNIMAGLGISFSGVFKIGDWVKIGDIEGKVVEMTPRSTKVLTFNSSIINIPNTTVSSAVIENYTHPDPAFRLMIRIEVNPAYRFEKVEKVLLDAVTSSENILDQPAPSVMFKGQGDSSQIFEINFSIDDYSKKATLWQATWRRIWRHLEQANIQLATPQREMLTPKAIPLEDLSSPLSILNNCSAFDDLSQNSKEKLAKKLIKKRYGAGEIIFDSEYPEKYLFIIIEGVVTFKSIIDQEEIKRLGVAEVFTRKDSQSLNANVFAKTETKIFMLKEEELNAVSQ